MFLVALESGILFQAKMLSLLIVVALVAKAVTQDSSSVDPNTVPLTTKGMFSRYLAHALHLHA